MARLSKQDWLKEGFAILAEFAQSKIRILYLCERLGVTRGSFYHHFSSIDNYIDELMKTWAEENTERMIRISQKAPSPEAQMDQLNQLVVAADHSIEAAIRSWGFYNEIVKQHLAKVDQKRLEYLQTIFIKMQFPKKKALALAQLEYATLIGIQQLLPRISAKELKQLFAIYVEQHWTNLPSKK